MCIWRQVFCIYYRCDYPDMCGVQCPVPYPYRLGWSPQQFIHRATIPSVSGWRTHILAGALHDVMILYYSNVTKKAGRFHTLTTAYYNIYIYIYIYFFFKKPCFFSYLYTLSKKNPSAWSFLSPEPEVTCGTVAIIIRVVLLSPYLRIRGVSLSSIHYNHTACILTEDNNTFA